MFDSFIQAQNGLFRLGGEPIALRGFAVGAWMNFENFMIRIPGTERKIRRTFAEVYGEKNAAQFFDDYLYYFLKEDDFIFLKDLGVNVLRFALNYRHFEDDQAPGVYREEGFKHLDRVLGLCRKYGIFAILDMHTVPGGQNPAQHSDLETGITKFWDEAALRERTINLWGAIAQRYKDETIIAGYDLVNEPNFVSDVDAFNDFFDRAIQTIREVDPNHIVFLEGDDWAKDFSLFRHLGGHQQAISFHFYPGQHVGLYDDPETRKKEMESKLQYFLELREETGMPLWVGETGGFFPKDKMTEGVELIRECLDLFEQYDISWTIWTYKDARAMGLVFPNEETPWMVMGNEFRPKWQSRDRRSDTVADEVFAILENKFAYGLDEMARNKLSFRIAAILDDIHMDYLVKPKWRTIPWEEMRDYPQSFALENCQGWEEYARMLEGLFKQLGSH